MVRDAFVGLLLRITGVALKLELNTFPSSKNVISPKNLVTNEVETGDPMSILILSVTGVEMFVLVTAGVPPLVLLISLSLWEPSLLSGRRQSKKNVFLGVVHD